MSNKPALDRLITGDASDASLLEEYQRTGRLAAFDEVFRRNKEPLLAFLLRLSAAEAVAQDVAQHVWLKVLELAREGRYHAMPGAAFRTFLFTLARNRYFDEYHRRHEAVHGESLTEYLEREGDLPAGTELEPSEIVGDEQIQAKVIQALDALPAEQREVIALWLQGFALTEVADITGAAWHTVVSRKTYAIRKLKALLSASCQEH